MPGLTFTGLVCLLGCCMAQPLPDHMSLLQLRVAKFAPTRSASHSPCDGEDCALEMNGSSSNESSSSSIMHGISKDSSSNESSSSGIMHGISKDSSVSISDADSSYDGNSSAEAPVAITSSSTADEESDNDEDDSGRLNSSAKAPPAAHKVVSSSADNEQKDTENMMTVYIQFGKVGSSSMRNVLEFRAARKGWPVVDPDKSCRKHVITGEKCEQRKENECAHAKEQGLPCGMRLCLNQDKLAGASTTCADEPADSVVLASYYGLCDAVTRPCQYVTLLREPVARVISSYNYWCLDCLDHVNGTGIFCQEGDKCPNDMTITEWAMRHGNDYTRKLATRQGRETLADGFYSDNGFLDDVELTQEDFDVALGIVQADNMLPLAIETFTASTQAQTGLEKLAEFVGDKTIVSNQLNDVTETNTHEHKYTPTDAEVEELKEILQYDIRLYEAAIAK